MFQPQIIYSPLLPVTIVTVAELHQFPVSPCLGDPVEEGDMLVEPPQNRDAIEELCSDDGDEDKPCSGHSIPTALISFEDMPEYLCSLHSYYED